MRSLKAGGRSWRQMLGVPAMLMFAVHTVAADPVSEAVLSRVYDGYDREQACWRARSDSPGGYCCLKIDRQDRLETATGSRLYLLLTGSCYDSEGRPEDMHASPGMVGALVVGLEQNEVRILAGDPRLPMGSWGTAPTDWQLVKLGPEDYWGWLNTLGWSGQGITESVYTILAPYGQGIRDLGPIKAGFDDGGMCAEDDPCPTTSLETRLDIDSLQIGAKVFPLKITVTGQVKGRAFEQRTWSVPFDAKSWSYLEPTDWPLADNDG